MPLDPFKRPTQGQPPSSKSIARLQGDLENFSLTTTAGDLLTVEEGGGRQFLDAAQKGFWAIINSQPDPTQNAYGFVRCDDGLNGTYPAQNGTTEEGDGSTLIAWEVRDNLLVPTDGNAKVWLQPNELGPGYTFLYAGEAPFPILLVAPYDCYVGYAWELLIRQTSCQQYVPAGYFGEYWMPVDNDTTLQPGRHAIAWADPTVPGMWMGQLWPMPLVKSVCPIEVSGVMTGIITDYWEENGQDYCVPNPADCCQETVSPPTVPISPPPPPVTSVCIQKACGSPTATIPSQLFVTFEGFVDQGNFPWSAINGIIAPLIVANGGCPIAGTQICDPWISVNLAFEVTPAESPPVPYCPFTPPHICVGSVECGPSILASCLLVNGLPFTNTTIDLSCNCVNSCNDALGTCTINFCITGSLQLISGTATLTSCDPFCMTITNAVLYTPGVNTSPASTSNPGTIVISSSPAGVCGTPPTGYNCSQETGGCYPVYDGSGQYGSLAQCQQNCSYGQTSYNCVNGSCVQQGGTGGQYPTLAACQAACGGGGGGNSGCGNYPGTATGIISNVTTTPSGCCTVPPSLGFHNVINNPPNGVYTSNSTLCGCTISFGYHPTNGWHLTGTGGCTVSSTLVSGTCTGNSLTVVFNVTIVTTGGCTITFTISITNP